MKKLFLLVAILIALLVGYSAQAQFFGGYTTNLSTNYTLISGTNTSTVAITNTVLVPLPPVSLSFSNAPNTATYFIGNELVTLRDLAIVGNMSNVVLGASYSNNFAGGTTGFSTNFPSAYLAVKVVTYLQGNTGTNPLHVAAH